MTDHTRPGPEPAGAPAPEHQPAWLAELSGVALTTGRPRRWRQALHRARGRLADLGRALRRTAARYRRRATTAGAFTAVLVLIVGVTAVAVIGPAQSTMARKVAGPGATSGPGPVSAAPATVPVPTPAATEPTPAVTAPPAGSGGRHGAAGPSASPQPPPAAGAGPEDPPPQPTRTSGSDSSSGSDSDSGSDSGSGSGSDSGSERESADGSTGGTGWSAVVDNSSSRFSASSEWSSASAGQQYGSSHLRATPVLRSDPAWYRFDIPRTGRYRVEVWFPARSSHNDRTPYIVATTGGHQTIHIDQQRNGGTWVSLGEFRIAAGDADVVAVSRWREDGGYVVADAVRVTRR